MSSHPDATAATPATSTPGARQWLVPFDGSDCALRSLRHAIGLARDARAGSIHVVTAHEQPYIFGEIEVYVSPEKVAEMQRVHSETLLAPAVALLREAGVNFTTEVLVGHIAQAIAHRADELGCAGIVMGTRGKTAIGNLILGSVANQVVHFANVPVTLIK